ncbi:biotin transporter BioY [Alloacidobacterium dinghuense]|uniref:Biotin transporter n=1 Tax=Alloacidobacterium dinghuense TaxID=2763107 RepID=A0A7G8BMT2_9BACT|nr:biotin transporter BioY [Alloacidobacterium dinghuense]QNI33852.1 biotin transporter BioY [Alloacidobacterium dinghuense]
MAQTSASSAVASSSRTYSSVRWIASIVAGSALVAICAHVSVPLFFTPVPMTLQPFAVLLLGLLLDPMAAFAALALYLVEGASGLPVFTPQGPGGMLQLMGPTGGYLMSYPFVATVVSFLYRKLSGRRFASGLIAATAGDVLILASGAMWMAVVTHQHFSTLLSLSVVPFLPGDALKVCAAAAIAAGWLRVRRIEETVGR